MLLPFTRGQITCCCPRKMLLPRRQITRSKLCFYYTCKFGVISIKYVIISHICAYYFIVLSCCLRSGILTIKGSKEKKAYILQHLFIFQDLEHIMRHACYLLNQQKARLSYSSVTENYAKETLNSDSHQFHQFQQNEQSPLILTELTVHKKNHDI